MAWIERTVLVDGYQPTAPDGSLIRVRRDPETGEVISTIPKKLPKAKSAIQPPPSRQ